MWIASISAASTTSERPSIVVLIIRLVHMCPILPNRTSKFRKKCSVCLILENRSCVMREMFGCPILQKRTHWGRTGWVV
ncbi:hypothetical protein DC496_00700 [Bifidobacterium breve]|uniref:Secreted protein n=1 Tax=Bifidobacterium breve TaxID=1685 RepID=A0AAW7LBX2_BIFBR|nr:hypothetical protein [Bifidobacterium breve]MDN4186937.1 hypothetical protein [Bifidobacterium breve]